ncbi:MAG: hypothetical protein ABSG26_04470 [Bryobacteraceae bacterium]|jgi:hypothetical protein
MATRVEIVCLAGLVALLCAAPAHAGWIGVQEAYDLFGHLENVDDCCAATATVNSFQYLINHWGYDPGLLPGGIEASRDALAALMGCPAEDEDWWEEKVHWIENNAPKNPTWVHGMVFPGDDTTGWYRGDMLTKGYPTWDWLWTQLSNGQDVEIGIGLTGEGHVLTLTSLKFDDMNGDGKWEYWNETARIDYLDPNNPTQLFESDLTVNPNLSLGFEWHNGGANPPEFAALEVAYAESPAPEPGTLGSLLAAIALSAVVRSVRRTHRGLK